MVKNEQNQDLGVLRLVCYEKGKLPYGKGTKEQHWCEQIFSSYISHLGKPISSATIVLINGKKDFDDLSQEERENIISLNEIIAFSAISNREFFGLGRSYCNRDNFTIILQAFNDEVDFISTTQKRRDGHTMSAMPLEMFKVFQPFHVSTNEPIQINVQLIKALMTARERMGRRWQSLEDALFFYGYANTDDQKMFMHQEIVMAVSAFQRLLECNSSGVDELVKGFMNFMKPSKSINPKTLERFKKAERKLKGDTVRELWIRDLCLQRNNSAHGKRSSNSPFLWNMQEHLLFSAYLFPLVLKCKLQEEGFYELEESDLFEIDLAEKLLSAEVFQKHKDKQGYEKWPWDEIRGHERFTWHINKALKSIDYQADKA
jgi:hypothetical protein